MILFTIILNDKHVTKSIIEKIFQFTAVERIVDYRVVITY